MNPLTLLTPDSRFPVPWMADLALWVAQVDTQTQAVVQVVEEGPSTQILIATLMSPDTLQDMLEKKQCLRMAQLSNRNLILVYNHQTNTVEGFGTIQNPPETVLAEKDAWLPDFLDMR